MIRGDNSGTDAVSHLLKLGETLSTEADPLKILRQLLSGALQLSNAEAGTIFKVENNQLHFWIRSRDDDLPAFKLPLYSPESGKPNIQYVSVYSALRNESVKIDDIYNDDGNHDFDLAGTRKFDADTGYHTKSMISVPMTARDNKVIGVMQIVNAKDPITGELGVFDDSDIQLIKSLSSMAAVTLERDELIGSLKTLLNAFTEVIAGAIDAKSPYTGGHCNRVPEIANLLAEAAQETSYKNFSFTETQWEEFRLAGKLHDCGKVTTPEYVVDKDTKLSTIYNRIHEVRMRFEVLRRDAEIKYHQSLLNNPNQEALLKQNLQQEIDSLNEDFEFVASCNVGGEFLSDDAIHRLSQIGERQWIRHYDDRVGLSFMDLMHLEHIPKQTLPCEEKLLDDKPEHLTEWINHSDVDPLAELRANMPKPEYMFNKGELYNLSIRRGTLSNEERFIINDHIVQTIAMLKKLPFPDYLKRIPEIAGGHHEKLDGTGYPLGLDENHQDLDIPARIMAIADIFEALTASDRPYKKAKTLDESLNIMKFMAQDKHIDSDLFRLFLEQRVFNIYAKDNLNVSQQELDAIDITKYLPA